jgi:hypothetical protein
VDNTYSYLDYFNLDLAYEDYYLMQLVAYDGDVDLGLGTGLGLGLDPVPDLDLEDEQNLPDYF